MIHNNCTHLEPVKWARANRLLIKKAISEFAHELILEPKVISQKENTYQIQSDTGAFYYQFKAQKMYLDHWVIFPETIIKINEKNEELELDALHFIIEFKNTLGIPDEFLGAYLEEITSTLSGTAYKLMNEHYLSDTLVNKDFQCIEHAMTEGHPCFVANNGRIGFNIEDYHQYAPETNQPFKILWLAVTKKHATFTGVTNYDYDTVLMHELGGLKIASFHQQIKNKHCSVANYLLMPVHPWQWKNKITSVFAADIANNNIILVGESDDYYSAQQSIRTLFNQSNPTKLYTKVALSILNMGFMRGLSPYYMQSTPPITKWITALLKEDVFLTKNGFTMLGEVATIGYQNHYYEVLGKTNPHNKMLSALWRESPFSKINSSQKPVTMASFLHVDSEGNSLLSAFIKSSGISAKKWIQQYLTAYLTPLLHCFYKYEFVFMPHGENLIMVLENNIPVFALMKDITEEVIVFNETMDLPPHVERLFTKTTDVMKVLSIFTDVFDCFFRFMAEQLQKSGDLLENEFWELVADCIYDYQEANPQFYAKYERHDLFVETFDRCCLNRLQLSNTKQMLNLSDPIESLKLTGILKNPIAQFKRQSSSSKSIIKSMSL